MYSGQTKVLYTAPELLNRPPVTEEEGMAGDVWALGVIATECLVGKSPFASRDMPSGEQVPGREVALCERAI